MDAASADMARIRQLFPRQIDQNGRFGSWPKLRDGQSSTWSSLCRHLLGHLYRLSGNYQYVPRHFLSSVDAKRVLLRTRTQGNDAFRRHVHTFFTIDAYM